MGEEMYQGHIIDCNAMGQGVLKHEGLAVFLDGGIPGDEVGFILIEKKKNYAVGRLIEILHPSDDRIEAPCPYAGSCGGCQIQHMAYEAQLSLKWRQVKNALQRIGGLKDVEVAPVLGMKDPYRYRNKVQMPVQKRKGRYHIGFYKAKSHDVVDVENCLIQHEKADEILKVLRRFLEERAISCYDEKTGEGLVRHILIKVDFETTKSMVVVVINGEGLPHEEVLIRELRENIQGLSGLLINRNKKRGNAVLGKDFRLLWGAEKLPMHLNHLRFLVSAPAFFQVNPIQTQVLYEKVLAFLDLKGDEVVYDLYCGAGSISLFLAQRAQKVIGIETVKEAVLNARENALENQIENAFFYEGKAEDVFPRLYEEGLIADGVVLDPPRKGCDPKVIETVLKMNPSKIVYVSCNPATLARDLALFAEGGYGVRVVQPIDVFCHSMHVEAVALLSRGDNDSKKLRVASSLEGMVMSGFQND